MKALRHTSVHVLIIWEATCKTTNPYNSAFPCFDGDLPVICWPDCHISLWWSRWDVCSVCAVCYHCGAETMRAWMEDEFRLAHTLSETLAEQRTVWLPFVTQIQMWPVNKSSSVLGNLKPRADFLNCRLLCLFVLNMSCFMKTPSSFV